MVSLSHAPKSAHYRDELQPFIGSCIEAIGQLDGIETTKSYNRLLIDNPREKHPARIVLFRAHYKAPHPQCGFSSLISLSMNGFPSSFFFLRFGASFLDYSVNFLISSATLSTTPLARTNVLSSSVLFFIDSPFVTRFVLHRICV